MSRIRISITPCITAILRVIYSSQIPDNTSVNTKQEHATISFPSLFYRRDYRYVGISIHKEYLKLKLGNYHPLPNFQIHQYFKLQVKYLNPLSYVFLQNRYHHYTILSRNIVVRSIIMSLLQKYYVL